MATTISGGAKLAFAGGEVLAIGLLSLIGANILVFATASQVFGDPFVLLMLGLMLGFVLRARGQGAAHNLSVSNDSLAAEQERAG